MNHRIFGVLLLGTLGLSACQDSITPPDQREDTPALGKGSADPIATLKSINEKLRKQRRGIAIEAVEFFTIGQRRPDNRIRQLPFRWVANDPRRLADGEAEGPVCAL